ncbi:MAG: vWA domain-containing protein [Polyangiaceae bacterium]
MRIISSSLSALVLLATVTSGCGGKGDDSQVNGNGTGASSSGGSGSNIDPTGSGNGTGTGNSTGNGTVVDPQSACAKGTANATLAGVNMFVMFDRSSSMNESATRNGPTRWALTSAALSSFFASPNAAGLSLALRFFPHDLPAAGCSQQACDANACAMPLVGLAALTAAAAPADTQEKALLDATKASAPGMSGSGTPIYAALGGALQWASAQHQKSAGENNVVVLVTDGQPNGCDTDVGHISKLAADALAADGTRTYAIGLTGSQESDMDQIAKAGGTTQGIFVADGANTTQDLLDALGAIRGAILDCDFPLPQPKPGVAVDPALINVNLTPSSGTASTLIQVASEAECVGNAGWYYDNPGSPSRIVLCKSTCDGVTADPKASLEILLGCPTSTDVPS